MEENNWKTQLSTVSKKVNEHFGKLEERDLNWRPESGVWSIAQNLQHLIITNESYFPVFKAIQNGTHKTPALGKIGFFVSFCGKMILKAVEPERKKPMNTFPVWQPKKEVFDQGIVERFVNHQTALIAEVGKMNPFLNDKLVIASPANKNIVYTLEIALDIIVSHEKRHLNQALDLLNHFD
ncbi:DinB family protein [Flagellimonas meridianipacifica]|uniref:DinB family protein n=1 Tax=Flagellimonas meridianipacifica TaxID=1080225 RepID=A0A2T0MBK5_9FLAO|nr:DinB family protein [Allomuricauda pacifica]PRX54876.1 DinB family protein [Allomuricauda pacifica]